MMLTSLSSGLLFGGAAHAVVSSPSVKQSFTRRRDSFSTSSPSKRRFHFLSHYYNHIGIGMAKVNKLRHVESMAEIPSGAGKISRLNAVILGESVASEEKDLVFPSHDFSNQALVSSPQQVLFPFYFYLLFLWVCVSQSENWDWLIMFYNFGRN